MSLFDPIDLAGPSSIIMGGGFIADPMERFCIQLWLHLTVLRPEDIQG
jgi:hypothetical protein